MSGTYQLDSELWPRNPLTKRWVPNRVATRGTREPIFTNVWRFEVTFGIIETIGDLDFFHSRAFRLGGLYPAVLPHPETGQLTGFTGVAIENFEYTFPDFEQEFYAEGATMSLSVDIRATGV